MYQSRHWFSSLWDLVTTQNWELVKYCEYRVEALWDYNIYGGPTFFFDVISIVCYSKPDAYNMLSKFGNFFYRCYKCDDEVAPDESKKLQECVDWVRKEMGIGKTASDKAASKSLQFTRNWLMRSSEMNLNLVKSKFSFFWLIVYIICKATFYNRPHWYWSIGYKDMGRWRVGKTVGNKKLSTCLVLS